MKTKAILTIILMSVAGAAYADIQAPPGSFYTSERKLGRGISNILYGMSEIPESIVRRGDGFGGKAGYSYGLVAGITRAYRRMGYGFHELFSFRCPTYHGTFKPPYSKCGVDDRIEINPQEGLTEFPPELGFESHFEHCRTQTW